MADPESVTYTLTAKQAEYLAVLVRDEYEDYVGPSGLDTSDLVKDMSDDLYRQFRQQVRRFPRRR